MPRSPLPSPTLKLVAETAGVSISTVSKVLHGGDSNVRVSDARAEHIRGVAKELRYVPNGHARSLRTRRSETIGLVFENIGHLADGSLFNALMLDAVSREVFRHHYRLTILSEIGATSDISKLSDGRLDGLVWCKLSPSAENLDRLFHLKIPCVALCSPPPLVAQPFRFFSCNNEGGAALAVERMASLGHKKILFVLEKGETATPDAVARLEGFSQACLINGIEYNVLAWNYDAAEFGDWWKSNPGYTAIFAWNEGVAGNILRQAQRLSVRVPRDLSVVGFDSTMYCETTTPRLTAVRQPISVMAQAATEQLFKLLDGAEQLAVDSVFECTFDERESLGAAP